MKPQTISAFAKRFKLSRGTLLYYDRIGLLKPGAVNPAGYRLYGEREAARMHRIDTFRAAGLPLKAIRELLDGETGGSMEAALERRLAALNQEIGLLHAQRRLVVGLLGHDGGQARCRALDVHQWVQMMEQAGIDEAGRWRWHQAFERDAPEAHQEFLQSLGLDAQAVAAVRRRSRDADAAPRDSGDSDGPVGATSPSPGL